MAVAGCYVVITLGPWTVQYRDVVDPIHSSRFACKMDDEFVSYRSPRTIVAETVYHFFRGGMYGFAYGLVSRK